MDESVASDRAVVLGGSIAGLLAARVLSDFYAEVTVVERERLDGRAGPRRGVPQGRHIHGLAARGQQVLEELFPGLEADLRAREVPMMDMLGQARLHLGGHRLARARSGIVVVSASRPLLEGYVRERVSARPGVTMVDACDVVGLATTPDGARVTGARIIRRADGSAEETLRGDLVVDATGRASRTGVWLDEMGYGRPAVEKVTVRVGYASGLFRLRPGALGGDLAVIIAPTPSHPRGGGLSAVEDGRHIVTLMGVLGDHPPTDLDGFRAFARSLQFPDIHDALRGAELLSPLAPYRFPASTRHRYERLSRLPDGLVVVGDAACSFNPIYGQGMSVAAMEALALRDHLTTRRPVRSRALMREIARVVDVPWDMAAGGDLAFPGVEGRRTPKVLVGNAYVALLHAAAERDSVLGTAFLRAAGMVDRPERLFRPGVVLRVLRHTFRTRLSGPLALRRARPAGQG